MYIWKTKELISDLSREKMSQWEMTQYLIATAIFWYVFGDIYFNPEDEGISDWILKIILATIDGIGIYYCFTVNRRIDNENFIIRFTVLSWPVTLRWVLISISSYLIIAVLFINYTKIFVYEYLFMNIGLKHHI